MWQSSFFINCLNDVSRQIQLSKKSHIAFGYNRLPQSDVHAWVDNRLASFPGALWKRSAWDTLFAHAQVSPHYSGELGNYWILHCNRMTPFVAVQSRMALFSQAAEYLLPPVLSEREGWRSVWISYSSFNSVEQLLADYAVPSFLTSRMHYFPAWLVWNWYMKLASCVQLYHHLQIPTPQQLSAPPTEIYYEDLEGTHL